MFLALKYGLFALVATLGNLSAQDIVIRLIPGKNGLYLSIACGTLVGLVLKYLLDKKYIFRYRTSGIREDGRTFVLYTWTGVFTTCIFWFFELGFEYVFQDKTMRYLGAVLGLTIGYIIKYNMDKKYVFGHQ